MKNLPINQEKFWVSSKTEKVFKEELIFKKYE
jgi:hypothetical protein